MQSRAGGQQIGAADRLSRSFRDLCILRFRRGEEIRYAVWTTGQNVKRPVPAPSERVTVVRAWDPPLELDAPNGWVTLHLDATPVFLMETAVVSS
jgi:hypothetical protein